MGGQAGKTIDVTYEGSDLDDAEKLYFSTSGITFERKGPGLFSVTIASNVPPGLYETRIAGRFGISNPRFFEIGNRAELSVSGTNITAESGLTIPFESTINACAPLSGAHFYRFEATNALAVSIFCQGEPFDSKMVPSLVLYDAHGHELKQARQLGRLDLNASEGASYLLKVHDLQYRGGKQFGYRLTLTARTNEVFPRRLSRLPVTLVTKAVAERSAQKVTVPCEINGNFDSPDQIDRYEFAAKKGEIFWAEIISDKLGEPTDPFMLLQRVKEDGNVEDLQEVYDGDANLGGAIFNTSSRDPAARLEVKADGLYRIEVRDLFAAPSHPPGKYRLSIRPETPDFNLVALITPPPTFEKDKREAQVWSPFLRSNDQILLKVLALRRDNFSGEISIKVEGLPAGVTASESIIPEGQNIGWLSLRADEKASEWSGPIRIIGQAKVGPGEVERVAGGATVSWDVPDYNNEAVRSRLMQEIVIATSSESAPFSLSCTQTRFELAQAASLSIPVRLTRTGEFKQPVKLRAYIDAQNDPVKESQVEGGVNETSLELDLKQTKLAPGGHQLFFLAQTAGKIRRVRADEVAGLEAAAKQNEAEKKDIEEKLKFRDVSGIFASPVIRVFVNPPPTASK